MKGGLLGLIAKRFPERRWIAKGAKGLPGFVYRHPVLSAGVAGTGVALSDMGPRIRATEADLVSNRLGGPMATYGKYSSDGSLEAFEDRKKYLEVKVASFIKEGGAPALKGWLGKHPLVGLAISSGIGALGGGLATHALTGVGKAMSGATSNIKERMVLAPKRESIADDLMRNDPIISDEERRNPGSTMQAYSTMARVAPTLSTDPNVATSFLRHVSQTEGPIDPQTVKLLAEAEKAVQGVQGGGSIGGR